MYWISRENRKRDRRRVEGEGRNVMEVREGADKGCNYSVICGTDLQLT